jgi:carboxyl-terminal processing protease
MPRRNLLWILSVVLVSMLCWRAAPGAGRDEDNYEFYKLLVDALDHIEKSYVEPVDRKQLLEGALEGMLNHLDPYSNYISPEHYRQFERQTQGHFGGIGIQIDQRGPGRVLTVITPLVGTPAYRGGILAGDRIVEIEGESTENTSLDEAVSKLTGTPGTKVTLTVVHEGKTEPETITLEREEIKIESVLGDVRNPNDTWEWLIEKDSKIAYVRINSFITSTAADLERAIKQAKEQGMNGLVLDLRFNPGGLLQAAIEVSDMFLKDGMIVSTKGRNTRERKWPATHEGKYTDFPIAVLVNKYSASASEIVAAALQDNGRAKVVGERTWGKGSVQNVIELEGGKSALKLTTAEYHRPNGHNIHKRPKAKDTDEWGVVPDDGFKIEISPEDMGKYLVWRRNRDVLRPHKSGESSGAEGKPEDSGPFVDKQLQAALDYVTSQIKEQPKAVSKK